jgi:hypothetical protein
MLQVPVSARRRPGNVAVVFALCLVTVTGLIALSLDGGLVLDSRRHAQSAADAAAIAAVDSIYLEWWTDPTHLDASGNAKKAAVATATAMGYTNGVNGCTVEVYVPPVTGLFVGRPCHCEVIIKTYQDRTFSKIWSSDKVKYGARAVARGRWSQIKDAIIVLDPSGKGSLNASGNGSVTVQNGPIQVNSSDASAMIANGNGTLSATEFDVYGIPGYTTPGGGSFTGTIVPGSPQIADPLAGMAQPVASDYALQSKKKLSISGKSNVTLDPGLYIGGIQITGGTVTLNPGVYYMEGGGFSVSGQGNVYGDGVMLYNDPGSTSDTISLAGSGNTISLSPMLSGPYKGITLFQNRTSTAPVTVSGSNSSNLTLTGTFYAAAATLNISGNGSQQTIGSQYISYDLVTGGNGSFSVNWSAQLAPGTREILLVE